MPFSIGQIVTGLIIIAVGAVVITEINRNNLLTSSASPSPVQNSVAPTPTSTVIPIFKTSPTPAAVKGITSSDPIVNCPFQHTGTLRVTQSKCDAMTDCEVSLGKWQAVYKTDCDALHKNQSASTTQAESSSNTRTVPKVRYDLQFDYKYLGKTYYCYEDRVNEISTLENVVQAEKLRYDICFEWSQDDFMECLDTCPDLFEEGYEARQPCADKCSIDHINNCGMDRVNVEVSKVVSLVNEICP